MTTINDKIRGSLLGLACGDALGAAVEFKPRGSFEPIENMIGGGQFHLKPGEWTDDTSMALCLAQSLIHQHGFDSLDQMRRYCDWMDDGYMSSNGYCFDIGATTKDALQRFKKTGNPFAGSTNPRSAGNGSIMRLAPIPLFYHQRPDDVIQYSGESSRTTHGAGECIDACRLLGHIVCKALAGECKEEVLFNNSYVINKGPVAAKIAAVATGDYRGKGEKEIISDGYVVNCLEAALWCFLSTDNFRDAVLKAVNLGHDADTTGAVCGQIAGAFYGKVAIPSSWLRRLKLRNLIVDTADSLYKAK